MGTPVETPELPVSDPSPVDPPSPPVATEEPEPAPPAPEAPAPTEEAPDPPSAPDEGQSADPATPPAQPQISDLPPWAQKIVKGARDEAARTRVEAKAKAAEEAERKAREQMAQEIGKVLGLVPTEGEPDTPPTPEQLMERLAAEQTNTQAARVELAVYKASMRPDLPVDPGALLDSLSFQKSVADIDPNDSAAVAEAIKKAVEANPRLLRQTAPEPVATPAPAPADPEPTPTPPPSGGSFAGGPGERGNDVSAMSTDDFRKLYRNRRGGSR